ncbi:streptomycin biosynthesis protein [Streptomyces albofaciens JCM 4342]|uniref:ParB/RepB/Spo0J family partition protein n=1 Tax=Streptomyces albofaciens TaxID=66866 RepID=UPI0012384091|nr:ParB N-terminal domain-containing protein [Streptomyces albofaciens]KAA6212168.1 streptomycin biosynthesis protein [Streptomyces albofaciens JCM 4342]
MEPGQSQVDLNTVVEVEISALSVSDSPRTAGESGEHVEMLAVADGPLPPILVHRDTLRVIDGMHRLRAARRRGQETIEVRFFDGDEADAFVLAVESNIAHGLPLTKADRKRAAERIIVSHPTWSNRMIAATVGLAPATVAKVRRQLPAGAEPERGRVGQDGRFRPLDGAAGRKLAGDLITENPDLSLRQIARATGISPETARDVRNRIRRGEEPLLTGRRSGPRGQRDGQRRPGRPAGRRRGTAAAVTPGRMPVADRNETVQRLKGDPALRYSDTGRTLLRLLGIHAVSPQEWERITADVPADRRRTIAELARACSDNWSELAQRAAERQAGESVWA